MPESAEELCLGVGREAHGQGEKDGEHVHHPHDDCGRSIDRLVDLWHDSRRCPGQH